MIVWSFGMGKFKAGVISTRGMPALLVQGCSKSKTNPDEPVPALDLYSGFFFKIIKKAIRDGEFDARLDISILSAEHGLINAETHIEWYDRKMNQNRATELAPSVQRTLCDRVNGTYETVFVNVGKVYRHALGDVADALEADVHYIDGNGIGYKGQTLKRVVRGDFDAAKDDPSKRKTT